MWTMDIHPGWPMCCIGEPSHCPMGACIRYVFSSSLFQCSSHGNCKIHIYSIFLIQALWWRWGFLFFVFLSIQGRKEHTGRGSWVVSSTCISCPPNGSAIAVTLCHWHIWRPLTPSLDLGENSGVVQAQSFDLWRSFLRWAPSLTAGLKHVWGVWHAAIQRDGSEGKSGQGKNPLREGWDEKRVIVMTLKIVILSFFSMNMQIKTVCLSGWT